MSPEISNDLLRIGVFVFELILTVCLIGWLRSSMRRKQEPWSFLILIIGYGALTAILAAFIELRYSFNIPLIERTQPQLYALYGPWYELINNIAASTIEELAKYAVAVFTVINTRHIHKLSDTIVYLIIIGLGFSLIEDAIFLVDPSTLPQYRLLSFYVHSGTSAIIGYSLGRFKFGLAGYGELFVAVLAAISLHFGYNLATSVTDPTYSFNLAALITVYISLQIFVLFRKSLIEEYKLETKTKIVKTHHLLNWRGPSK